MQDVGNYERPSLTAAEVIPYSTFPEAEPEGFSATASVLKTYIMVLVVIRLPGWLSD